MRKADLHAVQGELEDMIPFYEAYIITDSRGMSVELKASTGTDAIYRGMTELEQQNGQVTLPVTASNASRSSVVTCTNIYEVDEPDDN